MDGNACGNTESVFFFPQQDGHEAVEIKDIVDRSQSCVVCF